MIYEFKRKEFVAIVDSMLTVPSKGSHDAAVYEAVRAEVMSMARGARSGLHSRVVHVEAPEANQPGCKCSGRCCDCGEGC